MEILEVDNRKPTAVDPEKPKNKAKIATTKIKKDNTNDKGEEEIPKSTNPTVQLEGELLNNG
eukprot:527758-Ditylum_brightwellii.AAC.1